VSPVAKANFRNELVNENLLQNMLKECTESGRTILGWSHGHTHADNVVYCDEVDFPVIGTACSINEGDSKGANSPKYDQNLVFYSDRTAGTLNQYLVDVLCINPSTGMLKYFRFGAGKDRIVDALNPEPSVGESVYITVPEGDKSNKMFILGRVKEKEQNPYIETTDINNLYNIVEPAIFWGENTILNVPAWAGPDKTVENSPLIIESCIPTSENEKLEKVLPDLNAYSQLYEYIQISADFKYAPYY
jgi:hypothetical protein